MHKCVFRNRGNAVCHRYRRKRAAVLEGVIPYCQHTVGYCYTFKIGYVIERGRAYSDNSITVGRNARDSKIGIGTGANATYIAGTVTVRLKRKSARIARDVNSGIEQTRLQKKAENLGGGCEKIGIIYEM